MALTPADFENFYVSRTPSLKSSIESLGKTSYDSTITDFDAENAAMAIKEGYVNATLKWSAPLWDSLAQAHYIRPPKNTHRSAICQKLILNHAAILHDLCNEHPVSQLQLQRVPPQFADFADGALREVTRRLLGKGGKQCRAEELVEGAPIEQVQTWSQVATYLCSRIQSTPEERPGRTPDMTPESADVLRAALQEMWFQAYAILRRPT